MKVTAYLMSPQSVSVLPATAPAPKDYMAVVEVDTGLSDEWRFAVQLAESKMHASYKAVSPTRAVPIEVHTCRERTVRFLGKRYDLNGEQHHCKKPEER
jgi:hypothetical protein